MRHLVFRRDPLRASVRVPALHGAIRKPDPTQLATGQLLAGRAELGACQREGQEFDQEDDLSGCQVEV